MATSLRTDSLRFPLVIALLAAAANAVAGDCRSISSNFFIYHWQGNAPVSVVVHVMSGPPDAKRESTSIDYRSEVSGTEAGPVGRVLSLNPTSRVDSTLLATDDYKIVLDGKLEYLLHDIKMPDRGNTGCPIKSAMVNSCALDPSRAIEVDSRCGRAIP